MKVCFTVGRGAGGIKRALRVVVRAEMWKQLHLESKPFKLTERRMVTLLSRVNSGFVSLFTYTHMHAICFLSG